MVSFDQIDLRVMPFRIEWNGMEGRSDLMAHQGWKIYVSTHPAMYQDFMRYAVRLSRDGVHLVGKFGLGGRELAAATSWNAVDYFTNFRLKVDAVTDQMEVHHVSFHDRIGPWMEGVEVEPGIQLPTRTVGSFFCLFKPKGLIIDRSSVDDCLNAILKKQDPRRREIVEGGVRAQEVARILAI